MEIRRLEEQGMTRNVLVQRNTKETKITMSLNLDGTGKASLNTGIGFFDHMLDGFARHGFFDLDLAVRRRSECGQPSHDRRYRNRTGDGY